MSRPKNYVKTVVDGIIFDSKKEARRYQELKLLVKAGKIRDLELQVKYPIIIGGYAVKKRSKGYPKGRQVSYIADFVYYDIEKGERIIEDAKGFRTDSYKLKKAMMEAMGYEISEV